MPWKVRFRDKDFIGNEGWDPEFELEVREALTDAQELPGSAEIIIHVKDESVDDVTIHESSDPDEFPFNGIHGQERAIDVKENYGFAEIVVVIDNLELWDEEWGVLR